MQTTSAAAVSCSRYIGTSRSGTSRDPSMCAASYSHFSRTSTNRNLSPRSMRWLTSRGVISILASRSSSICRSRQERVQRRFLRQGKAAPQEMSFMIFDCNVGFANGGLETAEFRRALLRVGGQAFCAILGKEAVQLQAILLVDRVGEVFMGLADHGSLHIAIRQRGAGRHALRKFFRFFLKRCGGKHACRDADPARFIGGQSLPRVKKFRSARQSDEARQKKRGAEIRIKTQVTESLCEHCLVGRDS